MSFKGSKLWKILKNKYLLVSIAFAVWITFFDENNLISRNADYQSLKEMNQKETYYKKEIKKSKNAHNHIHSINSSRTQYYTER